MNRSSYSSHQKLAGGIQRGPQPQIDKEKIVKHREDLNKLQEELQKASTEFAQRKQNSSKAFRRQEQLREAKAAPMSPPDINYLKTMSNTYANTITS